MPISEPDGEFALIARILAAQRSSTEVILPNGDDAAVVAFGDSRLAVTTDSVIEGRHFSLDYFAPEDIGIRALEGAASDIFAVGGVPKYFLTVLSAPASIAADFVDRLYRGVALSSSRLNMVLIGGDTASVKERISLNVTVIGEIEKEGKIVARSGARPGDEIYVSGGLGGSAAGLLAFQHKLAHFSEVKQRHLRPVCRNDVAAQIAQVATSMIDISDGLSSEIHHLCRASKCGATLDADLIRFKPEVERLAEKLGIDPLMIALNGGEEFELLFTVPPEAASMQGVAGYKIGKILAHQAVTLITPQNGKRAEIDLVPKGFNHFIS